MSKVNINGRMCIMKKLIKISLLFCLLIILIPLNACTKEEAETNFHLLLKGNSAKWDVNEYEVKISPNYFEAGHGVLSMKGEQEYYTDFFHFDTHAVINEKDITVHSGSVSGKEVNIAEKTTGKVEGGEYLNAKGEPISLEDVNRIYIVVKWWDKQKKKDAEETITLYSKTKEGSTTTS
jgi:hypothetical protein